MRQTACQLRGYVIFIINLSITWVFFPYTNLSLYIWEVLIEQLLWCVLLCVSQVG